MSTLRTSYDHACKGEYGYSCEETEKRQRLGGGLTHVTESTFMFYLTLEQERQNLHTIKRVQSLRSKILFDSTNSLKENLRVKDAFEQMLPNVLQDDLVLVKLLFEELCDSFMRVANNEFRKKLTYTLGKKKKMAHRHQILADSDSLTIKKQKLNEAVKEVTRGPILSQSVVVEPPTSSSSITEDQPSTSGSVIIEVQGENVTYMTNKVRVSRKKQPSSVYASSIYETETTIDVEENVYCTCRQGETGKMIGCDGPCRDWYHYKCVGLKRKPQSKKWFCMTCKESIAH